MHSSSHRPLFYIYDILCFFQGVDPENLQNFDVDDQSTDTIDLRLRLAVGFSPGSALFNRSFSLASFHPLRNCRSIPGGMTVRLAPESLFDYSGIRSWKE